MLYDNAFYVGERVPAVRQGLIEVRSLEAECY